MSGAETSSRSTESARSLKYLIMGVIAVLFLAAPVIISSEYILHILIMTVYFAYLAVSWNIICGYVGQLSLGHSIFSGIAGYVSVLLFIDTGLSPWIGMFIGGLFAMMVGVAIGYPCFRLRGPYFTLTTIAFAELVRIWLENTDEFLGVKLKGAMGLLVPLRGDAPALFQFSSKEPYYYTILAMLAAAMAITFWVERSRLGYYLKAIKGDQDGAEAIGVNSTRYMLTAMAISSFLTGLGGCYYAQFFRYINPERNMGLDISIETALMAIVGGQGTIVGPVLGAFLLTPAGELARSFFGGKLMGLHLVIYGLVLVLVVIFLPKGLISPLRYLIRKGVDRN